MAWWTTVVFCALFAVSIIDRMIMILLIQPLSASVLMSDTEIGLLFGTGFAIVYTIAGLPLAQRLDRGNRINLVVAGTLVWSFSTILSAFAPSFLALLACRSGVAIGEAVLTPAVVSLFSDLFRPERRGLPTSLYISSGTLMTPGSFVIGSAALSLAATLAPTVGLEPWRITLILVGVPGLALAVVLKWTVSEPRRAAVKANGHSANDAAAFLRKNWRLWGSVAGVHGLCAVGYMGWLTWTSTLLTRAHGMSVQAVGYSFGVTGIMGAVIGMVLWPAMDSRLLARNRPDSAAALYLLATTGICFAVIIIGAAPNSTVVLASNVVAMVCLSGLIILPNLMIQNAAPSYVHARLAAFIILAHGLFGVGLGPILTATVAQHIFEGKQALGYAMASICTLVLPILAFLGFSAHGQYKRAVQMRRAAIA